MRTPREIISSGSIRFVGTGRVPTVTDDNFALHRALVRRERIEKRKREARRRRKARAEALRSGFRSLAGAAAMPVAQVLRRRTETVPAGGTLEESISVR